MQKLNFVIRGFLYKEDRMPFYRKAWGSYVIDFNKVRPYYEDLVCQLSNLYDVDVYFSTYSSTPGDMLDSLKDFPNFKSVLLTEESGSFQFTTASSALKQIKKNLTLLIRSDLIMAEEFIDRIVNKQYGKNCIYAFTAFSDSANRFKDNICDIIHVIPDNKITDFITEKITSDNPACRTSMYSDFICTLEECVHLHQLHWNFDVDFIIDHDQNMRPLEKLAPYGVSEERSSAYCSRFWKIYRGEDYDPCETQEEKMKKVLSQEELKNLISKLENPEIVKIDIGGGTKPRNGFINCDMIDHDSVDLKVNFDFGLPFPDNFVDEVYSSHCLEHVKNVSTLIRDIVRVSKVGAFVKIAVPHFGQEMAMCPGHIHVISEQMVQHFSEFEEAWWGGMSKKLVLRNKSYSPTQWFSKAKTLFPNFSDSDIYRFVPNTCHEVIFDFTVEKVN
jgi:hypothetical protein